MSGIPRIKSLYEQCICVVHDLIIFPQCAAISNYSSTDLESSNSDVHKHAMINSRLADFNKFLISTIPLRLIDELILYHEKSMDANKSMVPSNISSGTSDNNPLNQIRLCFYRATLHKQMKRFKIKNIKYSIYQWKYLFNTIPMSNVTYLNLSLSCTDEILELVPKYFDQIEYLNATCKYARLTRDVAKENAISFSVTVTDKGLKYLHSCRRLRSIITNIPRSHGRGVNNTITHEGLRQLIRNVPTLENINYSDSGTVIALKMNDLETINLKIVRHFNATAESLNEILRLCWQLTEMYLVFFENDHRPAILDILIHSSRLTQLEAIGFDKLNLRPQFNSVFSNIGANLVHLQFNNDFEPIMYDELIAIADYCPKLEEFFGRFCNERDDQQYDKKHILKSSNQRHFEFLEKLCIYGHHINFEKIVPFCLENATNLKLLTFSDNVVIQNLDNLFCKLINPVNLEHIELDGRLELSRIGILEMISRYQCLKSLKVSCRENCDDINSFISSLTRQIDFKFTSKKLDCTPFMHQQLYVL